MELFHAYTNRPTRASHTLAVITPVICIVGIALVAATSGAFKDLSTLAVLGGFLLVLLLVIVPVCFQIVSVEEIYIDEHALLLKRKLGQRVKEKSVRLAPDARAEYGIDRRPHVGSSGPYMAIHIKTFDGNTFYFGEGLNRSQQQQLAEDINDYLARAGDPST